MDRIAGCLVGGAVGDALGLPFEGLRPGRVARRLGDRPLGHRFLFGRGMVSDDTEHACLTAQALLRSKGDEMAFGKALAWGLRGWLLGVPAGIGLATLKSGVKLWVGIPYDRSGVASAGNGPAMRAAILGAVFFDDLVKLRRLVEVSSQVTHTDPRAVDGAWLIALATACAARGEGFEGFLRRAEGTVPVDPWGEVFTTIDAPFGERGVSGFIVPTVRAVLQSWSLHPGDFRGAIEHAVRLGGDTDTVGALVGGILGAQVGRAGVPEEWVAGLWEWPRTVTWMERLAGRLSGVDWAPLPVAWPLVLPRNLVFLGVVLGHGFGRVVR